MRLSRPPPLRTLRAFCIAARCLSFKTAADELCVTASAVSHQIKELEERLGVMLFERRTRSVELTTAGRALLEEIDPLIEALDRGVARIARRNRRMQLRVQLPPLFAAELFIPHIAAFCEAHPSIDIQLDTRDPRPAQHPPAADLSVLLVEAAPQGLRATRLFSTALVAACAARHAAAAERLGARLLVESALIVHRAMPSAWSNWALEAGLDEPEPRSVIELDSMVAVLRAAERGAGLALVPLALSAGWFDSGRLVRLFPVDLAVVEAYFLVSRPKDSARPEVAALTRFILEHCPRPSNTVQGPSDRTVPEQRRSQTG
jgi:LysR family transcriptional regulator, glycine cleavage system transcriptional activator